MQLGMIGLGRMGGSMVRRLMRGGHTCVVYDLAVGQTFALAREGATPAESLEDLVGKLSAPRVVWIMLPSGETTGRAISELGDLLSAGDIIVDGGNSHYSDDLTRGEWLRDRGIEFVDCGTSGGIWGEQRGYCLMIGGSRETVKYLDAIWITLAPGEDSISRTPGRAGKSAERGYLHCGPIGAGHFVKMVHNGIEYGLMQAFAEGFDLLHNATTFGYQLPIPDVAEVWRHGSVISAWLLDLTAAALARSPELADVEGRVGDSGEGRWALEAATQAGVPCPATAIALFTRFRSQVEHTFGEKILSAMRLGFGGHVESPQPVSR
jgi:6-phosphogluconate dehydrogenase